jgi:DNA modification methylase
VIQLFNGDCLEIMATLPDASVDMVLCDLPYGTTACAWDTIIPFDKLWEQYHRVCKMNGAMVFTTSDRFTAQLAMSNREEYRTEWVWIKNRATGFLNVKIAPLKSHEHVLGFWREEPIYNAQAEDSSSLLRIDCERGSHPTQKPVKLMEYFIRSFTKAGETVLDNTMGSGTTGVACQKLGRNFIGIEFGTDMYATAVARITSSRHKAP